MNSAAVDLVAALRRPVMPSFHAAFSLGGHGRRGPRRPARRRICRPPRHLLLLTAVGLVVTAAAGRVLLRRPGRRRRPKPIEPGGRGAAPARRRRCAARRLVVASSALIALCTAYGEGALADWGALHISAGPARARRASPPPDTPSFALAMTVGRLSGTGAAGTARPDPRRWSRAALTAAAGMLLGALAPTVWLALLGFARHRPRPGQPLPGRHRPGGRARRPQRGRGRLHPRLRRHAAGPARDRLPRRLVLAAGRADHGGGAGGGRGRRRVRHAQRHSAPGSLVEFRHVTPLVGVAGRIPPWRLPS